MKLAASVVIALVLSAPVGSAQQPSEPLPASTLPLRLAGVLRDSTTPARSAALIQCGDAQEQRAARLFAVGDRACDVAEVRDVLAEGVVIRNVLTNRLEFLPLQKVGASQASPSAPPEPGEAHVEPEPEAPAGPIVLPAISGVVMVDLSEAMLRRYRANLPEVLTSALATPHYPTAGSGPAAIDGYEITRITPGGIVEKLGLQNGDVLLEFNGQKLDSLSAVTGLLWQAQSLDGGKLTALRDGTKVTFIYTVR
jgi:hypothetical protein